MLADLERRGFGLTTHFDPDPQRAAYNEGRRSLFLHILSMATDDASRATDDASRATDDAQENTRCTTTHKENDR